MSRTMSQLLRPRCSTTSDWCRTLSLVRPASSRRAPTSRSGLRTPVRKTKPPTCPSAIEVVLYGLRRRRSPTSRSTREARHVDIELTVGRAREVMPRRSPTTGVGFCFERRAFPPPSSFLLSFLLRQPHPCPLGGFFCSFIREARRLLSWCASTCSIYPLAANAGFCDDPSPHPICPKSATAGSEASTGRVPLCLMIPSTAPALRRLRSAPRDTRFSALFASPPRVAVHAYNRLPAPSVVSRHPRRPPRLHPSATSAPPAVGS